MLIRGASFARARVLMEIGTAGGSLRSIDLATGFGYAPRTITEIIDGLERDKLVKREPDPSDRRAKRLSLTSLGENAAKRAETARKRFIQEVYGVLDDDECDAIVRIVAKLNDRLSEFDD